MGGFGSGWQGPKKGTVEDCLTLSVADLLRKGALCPGSRRTGLWGWWHDGKDRPYAAIRYELDLRDPNSAWLCLEYTTEAQSQRCYIWLRVTRPNYGGRRWWFRCPVLGITVGKLYLPPEGACFASRKAFGLTYRSYQQSGTLDIDKLRRQLADLSVG